MLQGRQTNAEGHHINKGITGQLLSPGGGIGQEVAADDLHQNAEAETDEENGADEVELYGKIYAVERKYRRVDGYTEIYLREKP